VNKFTLLFPLLFLKFGVDLDFASDQPRHDQKASFNPAAFGDLLGLFASPTTKAKRAITKETIHHDRYPDHQLDFSWYLMDMHGFIPWPSIISEPALGDFGLALGLIFISPSNPGSAALWQNGT
jgi:hypothetical protein